MVRVNILMIMAIFLVQSQPRLVIADEIKIGVMACLTGDCAEVGRNSVDGATLAVEEINRSGHLDGKRLRLVVQDSRDATNGAAAVTAYRLLREDRGIRLFLGPTWTPGGMAIAPIAADDDVIITSPSLGVPEFDRYSENLFNTWPHDEVSSRSLAKHAFESGLRKVAIFSTQQPWESAQATIFEEEFRSLGGEIVVKVEPLPTTNDLRSEAAQVIRFNPSGVFFSTVTRLDLAARELYKQGFRGEKFVVMLDETRRTLSGEALYGAKFTTFPPPNDAFKVSFSNRFGYPPGLSADTAYDTIGIYADALRNTDGSVAEIIKHIGTIRYLGVSGEISFDATGGVVKMPEVQEVHP